MEMKIVIEKMKNGIFYMFKKLRGTDSLNNIKNEENFYSDLMPSDDVDMIDEYFNALDWAININKRIRNIALSGPYGAGKSTIIDNYIKKANFKEDKYLKISLATFNDESVEPQLIEKNILEQIIYRIDSKKTPFSRFKKIQRVDTKDVWIILVIGLLFLLSSYLLYEKSIILFIQQSLTSSQDIKTNLKGNWINIFLIITSLITSIIISFNLLKLVIRGVKIAKIKFDKTEIEFNKNDSESIYNKYLDEILYFFEETKYEIVIFEDIDRFNQPSIFTNLREINSFLNNYENIKRRIIFLYAIKDDIFSDKERTKFFDFIIPVIPFVDSFNSRQIILNKFEEINRKTQIRKPSEKLLKDITIFLDDMRMLNNIVNEYIIYYKQINDTSLDSDKLFSIITYKNLYPKDFHELQYNHGMVKCIFDKKRTVIDEKISKLDEEILRFNNAINAINSTVPNTIEDINLIAVNRWHKRDIYHLKSADNETIGVNNILTRRKEFEGLTNIAAYNNNKTNWKYYSYEDIFTCFGIYENLFDMVDVISLKNRETLDIKKSEIVAYKNQKLELQYISLKKFLQEYNESNIFDDIKNEELLIFLIKEGYIDENYRHYMSHFYPGAITQSDMEFLRSVKVNKELGYEYKLNNVNEIIKDISADELKNKTILNNDLVEYLLDYIGTEQTRFTLVVQALIDNIDDRFAFITQFCSRAKYCDSFLNEICKKYTGFWNYIISKSKLPQYEIERYFSWIIHACDTLDIVALNENNSIADFMSNTKNIFQIEYDENSEEKLKYLITEFDIKFSSLIKPRPRIDSNFTNKTTLLSQSFGLSIDEINEVYSNKDDTLENNIIKYIIENKMYVINLDMIKYIYGYLVEFNNKKMNYFEAKNFSAIKELNNTALEEHIYKNIPQYLKEVFLKLPLNINENSSVLEFFLNDNNTDEEIKVEIIKKSKAVFKMLENIPEELWNVVIENKKLSITWSNIYNYFKKFEMLNKNIVNQINEQPTYIKLSGIKIDSIEEIKNDKESLELLYTCLYENEELSEECLYNIQKAIPTNYKYSIRYKLPKKRMCSILDSGRIEISVDNYEYLKENYPDLHYNWVVHNLQNNMQEIKDINFEVDEFISYLNEKRIDSDKKISLINYKKEFVIENINLPQMIGSIFQLNTEGVIEELDNIIFERLIQIEEHTDDKIDLLANMISKKKIINADISRYLRIIGDIISFNQADLQNNEFINIKKTKETENLFYVLNSNKLIKSYEDHEKFYLVILIG